MGDEGISVMVNAAFVRLRHFVAYRAKKHRRYAYVMLSAATSVLLLGVGTADAFADTATPQPVSVDFSQLEAWIHAEVVHVCAGAIAVGVATWTISRFKFRGDR